MFLGKLLDSLDSAANNAIDSGEAKASATSIRADRKIKEELRNSASNNELQSGEVDVAAQIPNPPVDSPRSSSGNVIAPTSPVELDGKSASDDSKTIIIKNQDEEIERLNVECLELEDTCQSLKQEIKDAWSTYTSMQEKTSIREGELVEEISQLEKLRSSDAAKWAAQQSLVESDVNVLRSIQLERDEALVQIADLKDSLENVAVVTKGITEAATQDKLMNQQQYHLQIQELHTEIRTLKEANEQIIQERNDSVRQANLKQSEIEQLTTDDAQQMSALYQENRQLQEKLKLVGLDNTTISELEQLRVRYTEVSQQLNTLLESKSKWELKYVELEKYHGNVLTTERAAQMSLVSQLQDRLSAATAAVHRSDDAVTVKPDVVETQNSRTEAVELQAKLTQLGHQLIAKQSTISDLQSDRTILKSMLQDAKSRCASAERKLSEFEDEEDPSVASGLHGDPLDNRRSNNLFSGNSALGRRASKNNKLSAQLQRLGIFRDVSDEDSAPGSSSGYNTSHSTVQTKKILRGIDSLDGCVLVSFRQIMSFPLLRWLFLCYFVILHIWVFAILLFHSAQMDEIDSTPQMYSVVKDAASES